MTGATVEARFDSRLYSILSSMPLRLSLVPVVMRG